MCWEKSGLAKVRGSGFMDSGIWNPTCIENPDFYLDPTVGFENCDFFIVQVIARKTIIKLLLIAKH